MRLSLLLLLFLPFPARAQGGVVSLDSAALAALAPLAARIDTAGVLRLTTPWTQSVLLAPRLLSAGIGYRDLAGPQPLIHDRAFRLERRGRASAAGAVVGALVLGAVGSLYGRAGAGISCVDAEGPCEGGGRATIGVGLIGAAIGGLVGAGIGSLLPSWRTVYQSDGQ